MYLRYSKLLAASMLLAALSLPAAAASVYRWVDKNGVVHYDDTSTVAERVTRDIFTQKIPDRPEWAGRVPPELVAEIEQRCHHASERHAQYGAAPVIYGTDPDGNIYQLSDTQARLMLAEIGGEMDRYCAADAPQRILAERQAELRAERERRSAAARP